MGMNDAKQNEKDDKRRRALDKKPIFKGASKAGIVADWASVDGSLVVRAVAAIGVGGGALRLGYTRDGGAYAIGIYDGDNKETIYVSPNDDVEETLREIARYYEEG